MGPAGRREDRDALGIFCPTPSEAPFLCPNHEPSPLETQVASTRGDGPQHHDYNQGWPCSQVTSAERWHKGEGWRPSAGDQAPCSELPYGMAWGTQVPLARGRGLGRGNPKDPLSPPTPHCVCDSSDGPWGVAWPAPPGWGTENSRVTWVAGCRGDPRRSQRWGHRHPSPLLPAVSTARNTAPAPVGHLPPAESVTTGPTAEDAELQGQA